MTNNFGEKIKQLRQNQGLTQDQLAKKLGVTVKDVREWEKENKIPNLRSLLDIADCFNITAADLLENIRPVPEVRLNEYLLTDEFKKLSDERKLDFLWAYQRNHPGATVVAVMLANHIKMPKEKKRPLISYACEDILQHHDGQRYRNTAVYCMAQVCDDDEFNNLLMRCSPCHYDETQSEWFEQRLRIIGDTYACRIQHYKNNALILHHFLFRSGADTQMHKERIKIIESLGEDGIVPDAWLPYYVNAYLSLKSNYIESTEFDLAYEALDKVLDIFENRISKFKVGDILSLGKRALFGDVTMTVMPGYDEDLAAVFTQKDQRFSDRAGWLAICSPKRVCGNIYNSMLEWVKSCGVPDDEKYKKYLQRVKKIMGA
ncbi:MAG: helix-turn-helix transcriptional regulator [Clostridia bacterium]|nr:helix-turn-helix transcriptional regulator [Clostridia bacterium]